MRLRKSVAALSVVTTAFATVAPTAGAVEIREITFPVAGDVYFTDTYGAPRSGGRVHEGVDLMGDKMTPLVAAVDGTITFLRHDTSNLSGNMLTITDADGYLYHYIHLNNDTPGTDDAANRYDQAFGPGIEEGVEVVAGQLVGYLGDSGNAESTGAHLHFEIEHADRTNINPYPSVKAAETDALDQPLDKTDSGTSDFEPFGPSDEFINAVFDRLWGRTPTAEQQAELTELLGEEELPDVVVSVLDGSIPAAQLDRLYQSFFLRPPDRDGIEYWLDQLDDGLSLEWAAEYFAQSEEFQIRYADKDFSEFLDQLYIDVLDREPDATGKAYWLEQLEEGNVNRGTIVVYFSESEEMRMVTELQTEATLAHLLIHDRVPSSVALDAWVLSRKGDVPASVLVASELESATLELLAASAAEPTDG